MAESEKKIRWSSAWADARELIWAHRSRLVLGAVLMLVNQAMGLVPVLKNVSFKASAGSTTALVGSSGSGKSTLISLAMNFNHPLSGTIKVDGKDLRTLRLRDFRSYLGVVMQDNFLFDGTIAENISFSNPHATAIKK